jgi:DNA-directed RNA polymerase specialized sigma24 family protein
MSVADYEQQLALDLWQRLPAYKPERAGLATFIDRTVRNRVCDFLAAAKTSARSAERRALSLEGEEEGRRLATRLRMADGLWEQFDDVEHEVGLRHDLARFIALLPPALHRCLAILTSGSIGAAVRNENLHRSSYYEALDRLRRRARQAGLHEYLGAPDKSNNGSVSNQGERPVPA